MQPIEEALGYRVLDQAGQGGFAVVYRAYQERLDRQVALKVLSVDKVDQGTLRRFQRELQLTGRLTGHPNVVTVFDTGTTRAGRPYIAMEFFEGGSLRDRLSREGPLPVADVLRAGVKLAGALSAVHQAGVLHGDIKPQNILISKYGEPAIADFGVARVVDMAEVSAAAHAFTPLHAAPEVLRGQPHSVSSDLYSLGSTLYHLLAGQPAFHNPADPSIAPLMLRVLSRPPPPFSRRDVPPAVSEAIMRVLAKQPEERYGTAREFAQRLQAIQIELGLPATDMVGGDLPGEPSREHTTMPRPPAAPRSRLRLHLVVGMAVAGLAGAGIGVALFVSAQDDPVTARPTATAVPSGEADAVDPAAVKALTPRNLKIAADNGASITLRWTLPANAKRFPLVLQREPADGQQTTVLDQGSTSTRVFGLKPDSGYCFVLGVPLSIGEKSTTAWSRPTCIRGAVAN
ncbi:serine/threonine-protein kinase [Streptosporangium sp. KLBMP 9127]|nr:protein kinase [Streptosporangium sp. KLBMP 9127]